MAKYQIEIGKNIIILFNKYFCFVADEKTDYTHICTCIYYKDFGLVCIRAVTKVNSNY